MFEGVTYELAVEFFNIILAGALFIVTYRVFTFFRRLEIAEPLLLISCGFYVYFVHLVIGIMVNVFLLEIPYTFEATEIAFIVISIYGIARFYRVFRFYEQSKTEIITTSLKLEKKIILEALREEKAKLENDIRMIKYRYLKREIDAQVFGSLLAEKERDYSEVKARIAELTGK